MASATRISNETYSPAIPVLDALYSPDTLLPPTQQQAAPENSVERLLAIIETHARAEEDALSSYRFVADASADPAIAMVMQLVLDDEERHHSLLGRIIRRLEDALNWTRSADALPTSAVDGPAVADEVISIARNILREERQGASKLRDMARLEKGINSGLDSLLLEMMALDSEKHARLLQYVVQRLEERKDTGTPRD